jgi:uncharacterized membrane protein YraQ (UPF0718 family)
MNEVAPREIDARTLVPRNAAADTRPAGVHPHRWSTYLVRGLPLLGVWVALYAALAPVARMLTYAVLHLPEHTRLADSVEFFLFEAPKVLMLLLLVVFGVGIVRSYFTPERTRRILAGRRESAGNVLAAILGVPTPFCSCSAVPLFIGFVTAGVPLGVTLSFLVASPMVNEVALVMLLGLFGWKIATIYAGTGLLVAILAGFAIGKLKLEGSVEAWVYETPTGSLEPESERLPWEARIAAGFQAVRDIVGRVWPYVLAGIAVGAGIHGYVPVGTMAHLMGKAAWWAVPAAVVVGVPMYSNAAGIIPIVQALMEKGAALGTVLAFMMAVIGLSLPEAVILRKVLKPKLIAVYFGIVATGILIVGYLFNLLL